MFSITYRFQDTEPNFSLGESLHVVGHTDIKAAAYSLAILGNPITLFVVSIQTMSGGYTFSGSRMSHLDPVPGAASVWYFAPRNPCSRTKRSIGLNGDSPVSKYFRPRTRNAYAKGCSHTLEGATDSLGSLRRSLHFRGHGDDVPPSTSQLHPIFHGHTPSSRLTHGGTFPTTAAYFQSHGNPSSFVAPGQGLS